MNDNLKPCPFCGQTEYLVVGTDVDLGVSGEVLEAQSIEPGYYTVCCSAERAFYEPPRGCGASSGYYPTKEEAMNKWNRREEV